MQKIQQRKFGRTGNESNSKVRSYKVKHESGSDIHEVLPPSKINKNPFNQTVRTTRACNVTPPFVRSLDQVRNIIAEGDVCSAVEGTSHNKKDQYKNLLLEQYGFDPNASQCRHLKHIDQLICDLPTTDRSCQPEPIPHSNNSFLDFSDSPPPLKTFNSIHNTKVEVTKGQKDASSQRERHKGDIDPKNIIISEVPRIKFIAEKFSTFKKNDIEVRKLNEKIVCVEYDIFDQERLSLEPVQRMRAFFSIKPPSTWTEDQSSTPLTALPSFLKHKYHISNDDLRKLNEKEIEIIDEKIAENRPYLDDLKRILKRKENQSLKRRATLDLQYLYDLARREYPSANYDFSHLLSNAELDEVKTLILKRCVSSVHGISRRIVKTDREKPIGKATIESNHSLEGKGLSESTILELIKDKESSFQAF